MELHSITSRLVLSPDTLQYDRRAPKTQMLCAATLRHFVSDFEIWINSHQHCTTVSCMATEKLFRPSGALMDIVWNAHPTRMMFSKWFILPYRFIANAVCMHGHGPCHSHELFIIIVIFHTSQVHWATESERERARKINTHYANYIFRFVLRFSRANWFME